MILLMASLLLADARPSQSATREASKEVDLEPPKLEHVKSASNVFIKSKRPGDFLG